MGGGVVKGDQKQYPQQEKFITRIFLFCLLKTKCKKVKKGNHCNCRYLGTIDDVHRTVSMHN